MLDSGLITDKDFEDFRILIYKECGIHFTESNKPILMQRLRERLNAQKIDNARAYYSILLSDKEELKSFLDAVTTNLTWFFRNQGQFDGLEHFAIPELINIKKPKNDTILRVWSAGCSTGEEPYSIAMLLSEKLPPSWKYQIVASDLSLKCLMTAKEGVYEKGKVQGVPPAWLAKYFDDADGSYKVKDFLKANIKFDYHNLKHTSPWRNFDIVFCRNVLIYFDEVTQLEIVTHFWDAMTPNAFIFIGHSESLIGLKTKFEFVKSKWTTLYKKWT